MFIINEQARYERLYKMALRIINGEISVKNNKHVIKLLKNEIKRIQSYNFEAYGADHLYKEQRKITKLFYAIQDYLESQYGKKYGFDFIKENDGSIFIQSNDPNIRKMRTDIYVDCLDLLTEVDINHEGPESHERDMKKNAYVKNLGKIIIRIQKSTIEDTDADITIKFKGNVIPKKAQIELLEKVIEMMQKKFQLNTIAPYVEAHNILEFVRNKPEYEEDLFLTHVERKNFAKFVEDILEAIDGIRELNLMVSEEAMEKIA